MSRARFLLPLALSSLAVLSLTGCPEEDTRLFDETGVWALEQFALEGTGFQSIDQSRVNRFLLRFSPDEGVVAAANCHNEGASMGVTDSTCDLSAATSTWACRCFAYSFDESRMVWQEFAPGEDPPPIGDPAVEDSGAHEIMLEATSAQRTYQFGSLPDGLFESDGQTSKHVFQIKATSIWDNMDVNGDGNPDLEGCSMACFPSARE